VVAQAEAEGSGDAEQSPVSFIDFRVGTILVATKHPESDKCLVEQVDVGEEEPRTICSGVAAFMSEDDMKGKKVVVVANLKERKIAGIPSKGMILCATRKGDEGDNTALALVEPPDAAENGERVLIEVPGMSHGEAAAPNRVQKKKLFEKVAPELKTNAEGIVCFADSPFSTSAGPCTASAIPNGTVS